MEERGREEGRGERERGVLVKAIWSLTRICLGLSLAKKLTVETSYPESKICPSRHLAISPSSRYLIQTYTCQ